jgi:hypothetical protein
VYDLVASAIGSEKIVALAAAGIGAVRKLNMRFRGLWIDISTTMQILVCRPPYQSEYVTVPDERVQHLFSFDVDLGIQDLETYNVWFRS